MNQDYEIFAEDIAKEWYHRFNTVGHFQSPAVTWDELSEDERSTMVLVVRSLLDDSVVIPGTIYIQPDAHQALKVLKSMKAFDEHKEKQT